MATRSAFGRSDQGVISLCLRCLRSFSTSTQSKRQQSATRVFADLMQANREQSQNRPLTSTDARLSPAQESNRVPSNTRPTALDVVKATVRNSFTSRQLRGASVEELQEALRRRDYESQMRRRWRPGDVYAPHDLSGAEMQKWKKTSRRSRPKKVPGGGDVIDQLRINPIDQYKNFSMMSEYMTEMGRIRSGKETGLRPVNQRRMARAIRRSIGIGMMPSVHRHPELIKIELEKQRLI